MCIFNRSVPRCLCGSTFAFGWNRRPGGAVGALPLMRSIPRAVVVALTVMAVGSRAENVKEEALRLIAADVKSGGKTVPNGPKPTLTKPKETKAVDEGDPEILVLPKVEVTSPKVTPLEKKLEELEREQAREEKSTHLSWLEALLNGKGFANARVKRARERVEIMDWERMLFIALLGAKTEEERKQIREEFKMFKSLRR